MKINGERLKAAMQSKGYGVMSFAKVIDVNCSAVSNWISGKHGISRNNLCTVANMLDVDVGYLTDGKRVKLKKHETVEYALNILRLHGYKGVIE